MTSRLQALQHLYDSSLVAKNTFMGLLSLMKINPEIPFLDFKTKAVPLNTVLSTYLVEAMHQWEKVANVKFVRDDKNPKLFLHFSQGSYVGDADFWGGSTMLDVDGKVIRHAALNMHLDQLIELIAAKKHTHIEHLFTHELGHVLGLHHPITLENTTAFRVDHFTLMQYTSDVTQLVRHPTAADKLALTKLYGEKSVNPENNTIYMNATSFQPYEIKQHIDDAGHDTLVVTCDGGDVNIDAGFLNGCGHYAYITPGAIEDVVIQGVDNLVRLNTRSNHVDLRAANRTRMMFTPEGGADFIMGFKCGDGILISRSLSELNITQGLNSTVVSTGNYTLTITGPFNSTYTQIRQIGLGTEFSNPEPHCPYAATPSLNSTFITGFLKCSMMQTMRKLFTAFGYSNETAEIFDRVLIATLAYYESASFLSASLATLISPALRMAGLQKHHATIIETTLCLGIGLYKDPAKMLTTFAGSLFAFGTFRAVGAVRDFVFSPTPKPKLQ
jgi:hypothetical protein